jgi:hypothetical protein
VRNPRLFLALIVLALFPRATSATVLYRQVLTGTPYDLTESAGGPGTLGYYSVFPFWSGLGPMFPGTGGLVLTADARVLRVKRLSGEPCSRPANILIVADDGSNIVQTTTPGIAIGDYCDYPLAGPSTGKRLWALFICMDNSCNGPTMVLDGSTANPGFAVDGTQTMWDHGGWAFQLCDSDGCEDFAPSRTFLISFTGYLNAPPGCKTLGVAHRTPSSCVTYPKVTDLGDRAGLPLEIDGLGMVNLIANVDRLAFSSPTYAQAFTFYTAEYGGARQAVLAPDDTSSAHAEALNWLLNEMGFVRDHDRLVLAGHSYGGHRARLFAEYLYDNLEIRPTKLILVDPVNWDHCRLEIKSRDDCGIHVDERGLGVPMAFDDVIVISQTGLIGGYFFEDHLLDILSIEGFQHEEIDDQEVVQRLIINSTQSDTLSFPAISFAASVIRHVQSTGPISILTATFENTGSIVATNLECRAKWNGRPVSISGCSGVVDPGATLSLEMRGLRRSASGVLSIEIMASGIRHTVNTEF